MAQPVDLFTTYQFVKRLITPFDEWKAYKLGIIDDEGKVLRKRKTLSTDEERSAWGYFDIVTANLKKLLAKVPGGKSKLGTIAAAALLMKEHKDLQTFDEESLELFFSEYEKEITEEIANVVGGGNVAGAGVGPQGEPGVTKKKSPVISKMLKRKFNVVN
jgi:hypothetical protein